MKVNKKALYALAQYYDAVGLTNVATKEERIILARHVEPCIQEPYNEAELQKAFLHAEVFFKYTAGDIYDRDVYTAKFNDANIAKLLRYIAREGKFPKHRSLRYV